MTPKIYLRSPRPDGYWEGVEPVMEEPEWQEYMYGGEDYAKSLVKDFKDHLRSLPVLHLIHPDLGKANGIGWLVKEHKDQWQFRRDGLSTWYNCNEEQAMSMFETDRRKIIVGKEVASQPADKQEAGEWQLCPLCHGQGSVSKPSWVPGDVHEWSSASAVHVCHICNGAKLIAKPAASRPADEWVRVEKLIEAQDEYIKFLGNESGKLQHFAGVHGMSISQEVFEEGQRHRDKISNLKLTLPQPPKQ